MYDTASELYNEFLETYFDEYIELSNTKIYKLDPKDDTESLFLKTYNYDSRFENEESTAQKESNDIPPIPPLKGDEEKVKEEKSLQILTPNELLTRLPVLLAQIKAGNNS